MQNENAKSVAVHFSREGALENWIEVRINCEIPSHSRRTSSRLTFGTRYSSKTFQITIMGVGVGANRTRVDQAKG